MFNSVNAHSSDLLDNRGNYMERAINLDLNLNCRWQGPKNKISDLKGDSLYQPREIKCEN